MRTDAIDYKIFGNDMQYVEVELDPGESVIGEPGSMMYMHDGITYDTKMGDGSHLEEGVLSKFLGAGKRLLSRESVFLTHYTNQGGVKTHVAFSPPYPGKIIPIDLEKVRGELICQKSAFLCAAKGTHISMEFRRQLGTGFFGGEGFILQKLQGDGQAFIHACGGICLKKINHETLRVDTGSIVAFTKGIQYNIEAVKGLKSIMFAGEGLFISSLSGSGYVWLQSLPFSRLADKVIMASRYMKEGN